MLEIKLVARDDRRILLQLSGVFSAQSADDFLKTYTPLRSARDVIVLDFSGITALDTAGVQTLLVIKRDAQVSGYRLKFINHSKAVLRAIEIYGLTGLFGDRLVLPAGALERGRFAYGTQREVFPQ